MTGGDPWVGARRLIRMASRADSTARMRSISPRSSGTSAASAG